jgi:hypothetical protein
VLAGRDEYCAAGHDDQQHDSNDQQRFAHHELITLR